MSKVAGYLLGLCCGISIGSNIRGCTANEKHHDFQKTATPITHKVYEISEKGDTLGARTDTTAYQISAKDFKTYKP